jgi:hypothetical protein
MQSNEKSYLLFFLYNWNYSWGIRYKNLNIYRQGIVNPYLTCLYILFLDRTKNDFLSFFWYFL